MTDSHKHRLSREILGLIGISAAVSLALFWIMSGIATGVAETYCFEQDIPMDEFSWMAVDRWIFSVSAVLSCGAFSVVFLCLLGDKIAYIRRITAGIDALHSPEQCTDIPLEGCNELTELASAINDMSRARQKLREREQALAAEKEQLIRTLSHDIRTPLTSILAYSDYLTAPGGILPQEQAAYIKLIRKKAEQIRDLTGILLDGSRRNLEFFENGRLLMEQITEEFQEELEEAFAVTADVSGCAPFSGSFDVQEIRRIFDNLASNIRKYADPEKPVRLSVGLESGVLVIRQENGVLPGKQASESHRIGLSSIRRITHLYGGSTAVEEGQDFFSITIVLPEI